jgi:hypothetical protein
MNYIYVLPAEVQSIGVGRVPTPHPRKLMKQAEVAAQSSMRRLCDTVPRNARFPHLYAKEVDTGVENSGVDANDGPVVYSKYLMGYRSVCHFTISDETYTFMRICDSETVGH